MRSAALALALALAACSGRNAAFCDQATPCPGNRVCDLASHSCSDPTELPDGGRDCVDDCPADAAICDDASRTCRACTQGGDCASLVCDTERGTCSDPASIRYVAPAGRDNPACSQASPCETLGQAIALVDDRHGFVHLAAGTYPENLVLSGLDVTIVGAPGAILVPAVPTGRILVIEGDAHVVLDGLALHGTSGAGSGEDALSVNLTAAGKVTLRGGEIVGNGGEGAHLGAGLLELDGVRIEDNASSAIVMIDGTLTARACTIRGNQAGPELLIGTAVVEGCRIEANRDYGLHLAGVAATVRDNFIVDNGGSTAGDATVVLSRFGERLVTGAFDHNTIASNDVSPAATAHGIRCSEPMPGLSLRDDIVVGGTGPGDAVIGCAIDDSLVGPQPEPGEHNLNLSPRFVDAVGGDYHLRLDSPGVDQGLAGLSPVDFDGDRRPQGTGADMGADEVVP